MCHGMRSGKAKGALILDLARFELVAAFEVDQSKRGSI
jgi:hypothetical protein